MPFECRLLQGSILKKVIESIKDLVNEANFDCTATGISLEAMDSSHVSLVSLFMRNDGFHHYRADKNIALGISLASMAKILKIAGNEDIITLRADDAGDQITFMFESPKQTRLSSFSLKLMDIDSEHLAIPETEYRCHVKMPSSEFQRICKEIAVIGDTVKISVSKEGVKFSASGDMGTGSIICKQNAVVDEKEGEESVAIKLEEDISLTFALRYLNFFTKATNLSDVVTLKMSPNVPLVVEYQIQNDDQDTIGYIRFYLAPKITEDEHEGFGEDGAGDVAMDAQE